MTERIAHRDLRNRSSEILRNVAAGATYEITNHGEVVAILSPASDKPPLSTSRVRWATRHRDFTSLPLVERSESTQDILDELRAERL